MLLKLRTRWCDWLAPSSSLKPERLQQVFGYRQESRNVKAIYTVIAAMREYVAIHRGKVDAEKRWTYTF